MKALRTRVYRLLRESFGRRAAAVQKDLEALPLVDELPWSDRSILVLAPHPDDESLGCGGLIALAARRGCRIRLIFMTDGAASHPGSLEYPPNRLRELREQEAVAAAALLGVPPDHVRFLRWPDGSLPTRGQAAERLVAILAKEIRAQRIETIFSTWILDGHPDHVATAKLARRAARRGGARLYYYPIWGLAADGDRKMLTIGRPRGVRLDITSVMMTKRNAVAQHRSQMTDMINDSETAPPEDEVFAAFDRPYEIYIEARC